MGNRNFRNNSEGKERICLSGQFASESDQHVFFVLETFTLGLWSHLSCLCLELGMSPKRHAHGAIMKRNFVLSQSIFILKVKKIISCVIIIQQQICNVWVEILLSHQEKNNNILLFFLLSLDFLGALYEKSRYTQESNGTESQRFWSLFT